MFDGLKFYAGVINKDQITLVTDRVEFIEKKKEGACFAFFSINGDGLRIVPSNDLHPIAWMANLQCADGAFFTATLGGLRLHLVELKSRVGLEAWDSVRNQFSGMFWNAWAVSRFLGLPAIIDVRCYIVYTRDEVRADRIAFPTLLRTFPTKYLNAAEDWRSYQVRLPRGFVAPLIKRIRPYPPEVDFGLVS